MKKLLLTTLAASISATAVHAAPTIYGQIDASIDSIKDDSKANRVIKANSNASRFGLKGDSELTPEIKAIYQAEFGVSADGNVSTATITGTDSTGKAITATSSETGGLEITQRDRFVGLSHAKAGTLKIGKYDSYLKKSQGKVDLFNDMAAETIDMKNTLSGENRLGNIIGYESPKVQALGGVQFNILLQPGENNPSSSTTCSGTVCDYNSIADGISASIVLDRSKEGYYVALAADKEVSSKLVGNGDTARSDIIRLVGSLSLPQMAGVSLNAMVQTAKPTDALSSGKTDKENAYLISASYKATDKISVGAQYQASATDLVDSTNTIDINQYGVMGSYAFNDKTKTSLYYVDRTVSKTGKTDVGYEVVGVSLLHKF